jgi:hypothetical protein
MTMPHTQGNARVGLTIRLNQEEANNPFEVTVFLKKPERETQKEDAVSITASGKLTLTIGNQGYVELFGENTRMLKELESGQVDETAGPGEGKADEMPIL